MRSTKTILGKLLVVVAVLVRLVATGIPNNARPKAICDTTERKLDAPMRDVYALPKITEEVTCTFWGPANASAAGQFQYDVQLKLQLREEKARRSLSLLRTEQSKLTMVKNPASGEDNTCEVEVACDGSLTKETFEGVPAIAETELRLRSKKCVAAASTELRVITGNDLANCRYECVNDDNCVGLEYTPPIGPSGTCRLMSRCDTYEPSTDSTIVLLKTEEKHYDMLYYDQTCDCGVEGCRRFQLNIVPITDGIQLMRVNFRVRNLPDPDKYLWPVFTYPYLEN